MAKSKIDWCDYSVNFITGCTFGCSFCYARRMSKRLSAMGSKTYADVMEACGDPFRPAFHEHVWKRELEKLERKKKKKIVFLGSMSDVFNPGMWLHFDGSRCAFGKQESTAPWVLDMVRVFCGRLPQHEFIILTKRPARLPFNFPPNVHFGVSITHGKDSQRLSEIGDWLGQARSRFSEARIRGVPIGESSCPKPFIVSLEPLRDSSFDPELLFGAGWVIIGAESGPGAGLDRRSEVNPEISRGEEIAAAAERVVEWCWKHEVPCFVKDNLRRIPLEQRPPMDWPREFPHGFRD